MPTPAAPGPLPAPPPAPPRAAAPAPRAAASRHAAGGAAAKFRLARVCPGTPLAERAARAAASRPTRSRSTAGQASVELVVLLPVILVVLAVAYQALLAGQAVWEVRVASRAAARAHSFGADASAAARTHLRSRLERGLRVTTEGEGDVRVSVRVPTVLPAVRLGRVSATSHFRPQSG